MCVSDAHNILPGCENFNRPLDSLHILRQCRYGKQITQRNLSGVILGGINVRYTPVRIDSLKVVLKSRMKFVCDVRGVNSNKIEDGLLEDRCVSGVVNVEGGHFLFLL